MRSPIGIQRDNPAVIAAALATISEFPDRQLYGEDVVYSGDENDGLLSIFAGFGVVDPDIAWAKLRNLKEGADLAAKRAV